VISDSSQQAISVDNGRATSHEQTHPEPAIRSARSAVTRRAATRTTATCWKRGEHRTPTQNVTAIADVAHPERHIVARATIYPHTGIGALLKPTAWPTNTSVLGAADEVVSGTG
jgi:hypothetical protein